FSHRCVSSLSYCFSSTVSTRHVHSFPTRRSSDLATGDRTLASRCGRTGMKLDAPGQVEASLPGSGDLNCELDAWHSRRFRPASRDRKSTRLNSSHGSISYAVFCLKKKSQTRLRQS